MRMVHLDFAFDWFLKDCNLLPRDSAGKYTKHEMIQAFAQFGGTSNISLKHDYWHDTPVRDLKTMVRDVGLSPASYVFTCDLAVPDDSRQAVVDDAYSVLERVAELEVPMVMIIAAMVKEEQPIEQQKQWLIEGLRPLAERAEAMNLILFSENMDWEVNRPFMGKSADCVSTCEAVGSPAYKLAFDIKAPLFSGETPLDALELMAPHVCNVHVANVREALPEETRYFVADDGRRLTAAPLDDGLIDVPSVFARLREIGFDGPVDVEYQGMEDPVEAIPKMMRFLREELGLD